MKIELGPYEMCDGAIIVVTAIVKREVTIKAKKNAIERVKRPLTDENTVIVFRDLEKHPVANDLEFMKAKTFLKRVVAPVIKRAVAPGTKEPTPLMEKL